MSKKLNHEVAYRGEQALSRLKGKLVVICGVGALGSNLADTLARQGVDTLRLIDMDRVEAHNVSTQVYGDGDVGATKVAAMSNRLFRDTGVEADTIDKKLEMRTVAKFLKGARLVVDAFDNRDARLTLQTYCREVSLPLLHGGLSGGYGEVAWDEVYTVPADPPKDQDVCDYPLARNLAVLVATIMAEETVNFLTAQKPRRGSWALTLNDLKIQPYR